ncbi:MAG: hypothetical protein ACI8ZM_000595 [Crocinitomix sp.]
MFKIVKMLTIINQIWEISNKAESNSYEAIARNLRRINSELEDMGYTVIDPLNRLYKETDADIDANIATPLHAKSKIVKVLKPIIYQNESGQNQLVQKGIVIVE